MTDRRDELVLQPVHFELVRNILKSGDGTEQFTLRAAQQLAAVGHGGDAISGLLQGEPRHQSDVRIILGKYDVQAHWLNPFLVITPHPWLPRK